MAIKYSVGVSSTARDRSLLERRRASSARASGGRSGTPERGTRAADSDQGRSLRGWLLMNDSEGEIADSQAFWAW